MSRGESSRSLRLRAFPRNCQSGGGDARPDEFVFLTTREEYSRHYSDARRYFTMDGLYEEFGKPWQNRALPMELRDDDAALEPFKRWRALHPSGVSGPAR